MSLTPEEKEKLFANAETKMICDTKHMQLQTETVKLPDGKPLTHEVLVQKDASVMIPVTDDGQLILVKQYRPSAKKILWELPAGKVDEGENPKETAIRELQEEIGKLPQKIKKICEAYSTPGYSSEMLHFYLAQELIDNKLPHEENETIEIKHFSLARLMQMIKNGEIVDCKTILGIFYYEKSC